MAKVRIIYAKSAIGYSQDQKDTIRSLGLRKLNASVIRDDSPALRGMVFKVQHLVEIEELADEAEAPTRQSFAVAPKPATKRKRAGDDIEIVEGIGPVIATLLREHGISTFAALAETEVSKLQEILDTKETLRLASPETWPEQAKLAADGQWEALEELQKRLNGGRR